MAVILTSLQGHIAQSLSTHLSLQSYVGKSINNFCSNGFSTPSQNHCAHFVSHVLGIQLGVLCGDMAYATKETGASIRCDEIYNRLTLKGKWEGRPASVGSLLIFVTSAANVVNNIMHNVPQKHVGIHFGNQVFHFSNSLQRVVVDHSVEAFHNKFKQSYGSNNNISLFFGVVP